MEFEFLKEWVPGATTRVLFGWQEGEKWGELWVPAPLIWPCASLVVDLAVLPIATVLIKNGRTHMAQWNKRVPDQWVGGGGGSWDAVQTEAAARKYAKRKLYWCMIGAKGGGRTKK